MPDWTAEFQDRFPSRAKANEPLAPLTTFGIGGPAQLLLHVESILELLWAKDACRRLELPMRILGGGSNVLVPDEGLPGVTVLLSGELAELHLDADARGLSPFTAAVPISSGRGGRMGTVPSNPADEPDNAPSTPRLVLVKVGAGVPMSRLALKSADAGLAGLEWAAGLPGTVGGAVVGNAGAWGGRVSDNLSSVRLLERSGRVAETPAASLGLDYRRSAIPASSAIVLVATFSLAPCDRALARAKCDEVKMKRRASQPSGRSAGSVFKNPPNDAAGRLLDAAGCKGLRVGGALVSPDHANFILNTAHATSADVQSLISQLQSRVQSQFNITLELELKLLK